MKKHGKKQRIEKEIKILSRNLKIIHNIIADLKIPEIIEKRAKPFGNGSHVVLPKEHVNKKIKVIVEK